MTLLDNAGNEILRFGTWGNQDSRGGLPGDAVPVTGIPLACPDSVDAILLATGIVDGGRLQGWRVERLLHGSLGVGGQLYEKTQLARSDDRPLTCTWLQTTSALVLPAILRTESPTLILGLAFTRMSDEEQAALHKRHPRGGRGERILEPPAAATP